jgi:ABC-2 type transport system ATP-binding protein
MCYKNASTNAVNDISFTVAPGSLFALLGPNGAGKTTTISILTTALQPTSGNALVAGHNTSRASQAVRNNIGVLFQKPGLDINLTLEENVRFQAILYGLYPFRPTFSTMPRAYQEQVKKLAGQFDIAEKLFQSTRKLSGGMQRKLEIIRCLLHTPKILFLDEPTTGLDPISRHTLWDSLQKIRTETGMTIFLTTHYLEEAEQADVICIMNKGSIVAYGTPHEIKAQLVKEYLVIDAEDQALLQEELTHLNITFTETAPFKVPCKMEQVHQILKMIKTPLKQIEIRLPSIEDAYLEIVKDN